MLPGPRLLARLFAAAAIFLCGASAAATLTVHVGNVTQPKGNIRIAVYDSETWLDTERWVAAKRIPAETGPDVAATFELPSGTYAVAVLHDVNGNEKMDYGSDPVAQGTLRIQQRRGAAIRAAGIRGLRFRRRRRGSEHRHRPAELIC